MAVRADNNNLFFFLRITEIFFIQEQLENFVFALNQFSDNRMSNFSITQFEFYGSLFWDFRCLIAIQNNNSPTIRIGTRDPYHLHLIALFRLMYLLIGQLRTFLHFSRTQIRQ